MNPEPETSSHSRSQQGNRFLDARFFEKCSLFFGLVVTVIGCLGIADLYTGIAITSMIAPYSKPIAFSAALIWTFFGLVIVSHQLGRLRGTVALVVQGLLIFVVAVEIAEFALSIQGSHFIIENLSSQAANTLLGYTTTPISPVASLLIIAAALGLFLTIRRPGHVPGNEKVSDTIGMTGMVISFVSFTFILSYGYGTPFLYGTPYIPIALISVAAALVTGLALVTVAGTGAFPLRYFTGESTEALLLRTFVPLTGIIVLAESFIFVIFSSIFTVQNAIRDAASLVVFILITSYFVGRLSSKLGWEIDQAEHQLLRKNEDLNLLNEELECKQ